MDLLTYLPSACLLQSSINACKVPTQYGICLERGLNPNPYSPHRRLNALLIIHCATLYITRTTSCVDPNAKNVMPQVFTQRHVLLICASSTPLYKCTYYA